MAPQPPPNTPEMKMKAEREIVRSPQIGTVHGDVYMGDLAHVNPAPLPESISEVKIPRLLIRSPKRDYLASESQWFSRSGRGMPGMTVVVENPEATVGHQGIEATGVRAKIKFLRHDGELLGTSEYAHWLDILENRTNISVGESRVLVVGLYSNPKVWQYFSNKIDAPMQRARTFTQVQNLSARLNRPLEPQYILFNPTIEVRITLLSKYSGFTLAQKSFLLSTFSTMDGGRDFDFEELS